MIRPPRPALSVLTASALAAACASSGARPAGGPVADPSAGRTTETTEIISGGQSYRVTASSLTPGTSERAVRVPPDSAFYALVAAYERVGLTPNTVVSAARTVGVRDGHYRQRVGKRRLSEFLECGTNVTGVPNADQYDVLLTVLSRATPGASGGSVVATQLAATAKSVAQSTDPVRCGSTGRLEAAINALVAVQAAR